MKRFVLFALLMTFSVQALALTFSWKTPTQRENGDVLRIEEIGLYEIRGKDATGKTVWTYILRDGKATSLITDIPRQIGIVKFDIAVADVNGIYSRFVDIVDESTVPPTKILPPTEGEIY